MVVLNCFGCLFWELFFSLFVGFFIGEDFDLGDFVRIVVGFFYGCVEYVLVGCLDVGVDVVVFDERNGGMVGNDDVVVVLVDFLFVCGWS